LRISLDFDMKVSLAELDVSVPARQLERLAAVEVKNRALR